jgi:hypothetical protein
MSDDGKSGDQEFLYDAFISYRHVDRDRQWAEWLITSLETFQVPKTLQAKGFPPRLRKIFRDEDELPSSADLNDQIRLALTKSRFLIVVCSAFTPRSKWVAREIEFFNELGRDNQVLALLTEGEPADSFPDTMLVRTREVTDPDGTKRIEREEKEPLAADVRPRSGVSAETSKRLALLRLVAVILGVKFDELRQREHEREHKRHLLWASIAAALVLAIGVGAALYWNEVRPKTDYFRQIVWRWGVPEGAYPIDTATHDGLSRAYSVTKQGGKTVEIRYDGYRRAEADGQARWVIHYGDDGSPAAVDIFAANGRLIRRDVLHRERANKMLVSFERYGVSLAQEATQNLITDPTKLFSSGPAQTKTLINRHELTFNDQGFATDARYQDNWGTPQHDSQGSFGERFTYTPQGLVLRQAETGPDGAEITLKNGVHAVVSQYDGLGRLLQLTLLGDDGRPINGPSGYASYMREYETQGAGNDVSQTYYDADGRTTLSSDGYSKLVAEHDERGNNTAIAYLDVDGKPIDAKNGYAAAKRKFDEHQNISAEDRFDTAGQPVFDTDGRAGFRVKYDKHGNAIEIASIGVDSKPVINREGYSILKRTFDDHGNVVDESYFDTGGKRMTVPFGVAELRRQFDDHDNLTQLAYFDTDGNPTFSKEEIARAEYSYDKLGNEVKRQFFGVDGKRTAATDGQAGYRQTFDERGNLLELAIFGINDEPKLSSAMNAAYIRYKYDDHGRNTEVEYLGADNKPIIVPGGYASIRYSYDTRGNKIGEAYFGVDGAPKFNNQHISAFKYTFDSRGDITEARFFGTEGESAIALGGQTGYRQKFDNQGNVVEVSYFGLDGRLTMYALGFAVVRSKFDHQRHKLETARFGTDDQPIAGKDGVAKIVSAYDAAGHEIERAFFGVDGKRALPNPGGIAVIRRDYDERGNILTEASFGLDGKLLSGGNDGYAKVTYTYNSRSQVTTTSYFGADGAPSHSDGCVRINYSYDEFGQQTKVTYLDVQGRELQMELTIRAIAAGGQAERIGLAVGDHLLTYNGVILTSVKQLVELESGNGFRTLTIRRNAETLTFDAFAGTLDAAIDLVNLATAAAATTQVAPDASR